MTPEQRKAYRKAVAKRYYENNKAAHAERVKSWRERNREKTRQYARKAREANPAAAAAAATKWRSSNPRYPCSHPSWANSEIIELIYIEAHHRSMDVDHIIPFKHHLVCGLHVHNNMQLLSKSINSMKYNQFIPITELS